MLCFAVAIVLAQGPAASPTAAAPAAAPASVESAWKQVRAAAELLNPFDPALDAARVKEGLRRLETYADAGDRNAAYELGNAYHWGVRSRRTGALLLPSDAHLAMRWYEQAAKAGESKAMFALPDLVMEKHPEPKPYAQVRRWYAASAKDGNHYAELALGEMFELGLGGPVDYAAALAIYRKYEDSGAAGVHWRRGRMYEFGRGVKRDPVKALVLYEQDASLMPDAECHRLALQLEAGRTFPKDLAKARRFYSFAIDIPAAAFRGAELFERGIGGPVDLREAYGLYFVAAYDGHRGAREALERLAPRIGEAKAGIEAQMRAWIRDRGN